MRRKTRKQKTNKLKSGSTNAASGFERRILRQIPLTQKMGLKVKKASVSRGIELELPLGPNKNHKQTAFGGTLVAAQAVACWAWVVAWLESENISAEVVVQRQQGLFICAVDTDFKVKTQAVSKAATQRFRQSLLRHKKGRIKVTACVLRGQKIAAKYVGEYVAICG